MRADAQLNRTAILETAKSQFSQLGIDVSMRSIAAEAEVGISTLYRHFPTREDLIIGVFEQLFSEISEIISRHSHPWTSAEEARTEWESFFQEMAAIRIGAIAPQLFSQLSVIESSSVDINATAEQFTAALQIVLDQAKEWELLRPEVTPFEFHLGLSAVTRPLPDLARTKAPNIDAFVLDTYFRGLQP